MVNDFNDDRGKLREAYWRKESYKIFSIALIRFVETISMSIVPSVISVFLILISQDPNSRAWKAFQLLSFMVFITGNCYFYIRFALDRRSKKEFYLINGITYAVFALITFVAYRYSEDVMLCSLTFAPLRGFEGFGAKTTTSIAISHIITVILMIICDVFTSWYAKLRDEAEREAAKAYAGDVEEVYEETVIPMQNNKEVRFLSIKEVDNYASRENEEIKAAKKITTDSMPDGIIEEGFTKGRGEEVIYVSPDEQETDDVMTDDMFRFVNENADYSPDSLWEKGVYQGRSRDNKLVRVLDYDEDILENIPVYTDDDGEDEYIDDTPTDNELEYIEENGLFDEYGYYEHTVNDSPYTSDALWEHGFYQGRDSEEVPEKIEQYEDEPENDEWIEPIYESESENINLWDEIERQGKKVDVIETAEEIAEEFAEELDDEIWQEPEIDDPEYDYDSENLWGNITQGGISVKEIVPEDAPDLEMYDSDHLWDELVQGDGTLTQDDWIEEVLDADANPYEEYEADSLWSSDIHQGRKKETD